MRKRISLLQMAVFFFTAQVAWAGNIKTEKVTLVGNGIVEFIPVGYDVSRTPSLILSHEPEKKGEFLAGICFSVSKQVFLVEERGVPRCRSPSSSVPDCG